MLTKRWENRDKRRYYSVYLHVDLLGDIELVKTWGGIGKASGGQERIIVHTESVGMDLIDLIGVVRLDHGYREV